MNNNDLIHLLCGHICEMREDLEAVLEDLEASNVALAVADKEIEFMREQLARRPFHVQD